MNWRMIIAIGALFLTITVLEAKAHENENWKHAVGDTTCIGSSHYGNVRIWFLAEGGVVGVIFTHGLIHKTKVYATIEELKTFLRGS